MDAFSPEHDRTISGLAGDVDDAGKELLQATYDCWIQACQFVEPGKDYKDIGAIIEDYVTPKGFSTVRNFCGHGIGSVSVCVHWREYVDTSSFFLTLQSSLFSSYFSSTDLPHQSQHFTLSQQ